ncbi:MAG TPA: sulfotransferase domain-containing protein [Terriglobales bacterium]|nr:sulfotransferase domain-containing protein [Terriglobales bacterium]
MTEQTYTPGERQNQEGGKLRKQPTSPWRKVRRKLSKTKLRVPHIWLRHRGLTPSDAFFASYPRSGTTWSRFTLFEILTGREASFQAVNAALRGIGRHALGLHILPGNGRLISTHEQYRKNYKKAIYLVRDARDVALSEFAYTSALEFFHGDLDQFLEVFCCKKISGFAPWHRHISSWLDSPIAGTPNLLVLRFEDLRQNPFEGFSRMAEFLGVDADPDRIRRAIANNALDKMKEKERIEPQRASVKGRFVRSGSVQGWRSNLTPAQVEFIEKHVGSALARLGYPVSNRIMEPDLSLQPLGS